MCKRKDLFEMVLCIEQETTKGIEGDGGCSDCRMTNLVSLVDKLLGYLKELLDFFGHYAEGRMNDRRLKSGKVCGMWCVGRKQRKVSCSCADVSFLWLSAFSHAHLPLRAPMHVLTENISSMPRSFSTLASL